MKIPFDIKYRPQIESGEYKVETRDGRPVKIISFEMTDTNECPIAAQFRLWAGTPVVYLFDKDGHYKGEGASNYDLFIVTPEEELSVFEEGLNAFLFDFVHTTVDEDPIKYVKKNSGVLFSLARQQLTKDGYVIEKKAFHDAVKKVDPKVMKEVSEKWGAMKEALRIEYERGKADALKDFEAQCQSSVDNTHGLPYELGFKAGKKAGYEVGKYDTLKDLPIWKRIRNIGDFDFVENDFKLDKVIFCSDKEDRMYYIYRTDLFEKLPKEDEK